MKLRELRAMIAAIPTELDDLDVLASVDDEGNGFRSLNGLDTDCYVRDDDYDYMYELSDLDEEDRADAVQYVVVW